MSENLSPRCAWNVRPNRSLELENKDSAFGLGFFSQARRRASASRRSLPEKSCSGTCTRDDQERSSWRASGKARCTRSRPSTKPASISAAAIASVANRTGVPVAVLRVATDRAGPLALLEFRRNVDRHAAPPASAVLEWLVTRNR